MTESQFQTRFSKWLKYRFLKTAVFELKVTHEPSIPFSDVKPHQVDALSFSKHGNIVYKIPDDTISQKPFDCFQMVGVEAYVVIMFYKKRVKHFYMIDIDEWRKEDAKSARRSLTEERALEIGKRYELED